MQIRNQKFFLHDKEKSTFDSWSKCESGSRDFKNADQMRFRVRVRNPGLKQYGTVLPGKYIIESRQGSIHSGSFWILIFIRPLSSDLEHIVFSTRRRHEWGVGGSERKANSKDNILMSRYLPAHVGGGTDHVVPVPSRDGDEGDGGGVVAHLIDEPGHLLGDLLEPKK